ncbi:ParB N-terminal domain-containing protein [Nitrospirillum sp. BR 11163]|uniref:ParB N-terminal domain-containing protein n=1 Tax=Nitrospirillum sp. BR 11163 TaxID=3104323 RepID=UPI002AFF0808|nr:ParB N-terminal domain-containing protein [Nitrospirillum sp. BR 11163]MEA1674072.1 ParB N-terminal domain-containing protein [Nitrospirillum sp. BR 11163]
MTTELSPLGQRVAAAMAVLPGTTVRGLARTAGLSSHSELSRLLNGKRQDLELDTLRKLAPVLGVTLGHLTGDADLDRPGETGADEPQSGVRLIPLDKLMASPLNPRKTFDQAGLEELADDMGEQGLLQNLTARPHADSVGFFEVYIGGRRLRAANILVERGTWPDDHPIKVEVRPATDKEVLALATAENVVREDMHPLEEGQAFLAMIEAGWTKEELGRMFRGKTPRWVELRMQMARDLVGEARHLFQTGRINAEMARELARLPRASQDTHARAITAGDPGYENAAQLHKRIKDGLPMIGSAIFDPALYTGELIPGENGTASDLCADLDQFKRLQRAAIAEKKAAMEKTYAWVEVRHGNWATFDLAANGMADAHAHSDSASCLKGALILVGEAQEVSTIRDVVSLTELKLARLKRETEEREQKARDKAALKAGNAPASAPSQLGGFARGDVQMAPTPPSRPVDAVDLITSTQIMHAASTRTQALQAQIWGNLTDANSGDSHIPMVLSVIGMLASDPALLMRSGSAGHHRAVHPTIVQEIDAGLRALSVDRRLVLPAKAEAEDGRAVSGPETAAALYAVLVKGDPRAVTRLFNALVLARLYGASTTGLGNTPLGQAVAEDMELRDAGDMWVPDQAYLSLLSLAQLRRLAVTLGMAEAGPHHTLTAPVKPADLMAWDANKLRTAIADFGANGVRTIPAVLRHLPAAQMIDAIRAEADAADAVLNGGKS